MTRPRILDLRFVRMRDETIAISIDGERATLRPTSEIDAAILLLAKVWRDAPPKPEAA